MLLAALIAFVAGVCVLQLQPALPTPAQILLAAAVAACALAVAAGVVWLRRAALALMRRDRLRLCGPARCASATNLRSPTRAGTSPSSA
jgi:hypothetical protein